MNLGESLFPVFVMVYSTSKRIGERAAKNPMRLCFICGLVFALLKTMYLGMRLALLRMHKFEIVNATYDSDDGDVLGFSAHLVGARCPVDLKVKNLVVYVYNGRESRSTLLACLLLPDLSVEKGGFLRLEDHFQIARVNSNLIVEALRVRERNFLVKVVARLRPRFCGLRFSFTKAFPFNISLPRSKSEFRLRLESYKFQSEVDDTCLFVCFLLQNLVLPKWLNARLSPFRFVVGHKAPIFNFGISELLVRDGEIVDPFVDASAEVGREHKEPFCECVSDLVGRRVSFLSIMGIRSPRGGRFRGRLLSFLTG
jgi:hypothetical protein